MEQLTNIGRTQKSVGLDGGIRVQVEEIYLPDFLDAEVVFLEESQQHVPYFVEWMDRPKMIMGLDGVHSKEAAKRLANKELFLRNEDIHLAEEVGEGVEAEHLEYAPCVGFQIKDKTVGIVGEILEVMEYPLQEMAALQYNGKDILIPLNEHLINQIKTEEKIILMDLPEGLLE